MKDRIKNILSTIVNNDFKRLIIELIFLVFLFNINQYVGLVFLLIIVFEIIFCKNNANLLYIYLFLSFFDEVLIFELLNGSISRIIMILILFKLLLFIIKNKILPNKLQFFIGLFFLFSCIIEFFISGFSLTSIIILVNIYIFLLFSMCLKYKDIDSINDFIEKLCIIIVFAVLFSIIYGVCAKNFLVEIVNYETNSKIYRFNGTYEPNFMCMFINLGILSLLTVKDKFNKFCYYILFSVMFNFALLTASLTGIITLSFSLFIYLTYNFKSKKINYKNLAMIFIITTLLFLLINVITKQLNDNYIHIEKEEIIENVEIENENQDEEINEVIIEKEPPILQRFNRIKGLLTEGKLDDITSGRLPLLRTFIKASFDRPIFNILFGNGLTTKKIFCKFFNKLCLSHNAYADFLYNFGILGFILIIVFLFYKTKKSYFLNIDLKNSRYESNLKIIRIMLLLYALSLTLYTKRMFLIFFLL